MEVIARQPLTGKKVGTTLSKAVIAPHGATTLTINGRGNDFVRKDSTLVTIFNVLAFATLDDAKYASEEWAAGKKLEAAKDIDGAQEHYKNALNSMMSFSVLKANAPAFQSAYQINAVVEQVAAGEESRKAGGPATTLGINNPRPVAIVATGTSAASLFSKPTEAAPEAGMAAAGRRARKKVA